ncbi:MAG: hypothetical protein MJ014_00095 [Methanocorpusculum sp.]|nr:hypothetical protein [Methanocorpusculum sp.]
MGLKLYCHEPQYVVKTGWNTMPSFSDPDMWNQLQMPTDHEKCLDEIYRVQANGSDAASLPLMPSNFTDPLLCSDDAAGKAAHLLEYISAVSLSYNDVNAAGILQAQIHPNSFYPAEGDYLTAVWEEEASKDGTGQVIFYGRVVSSKINAAGEVEIKAADVLQALSDTDTISVHEMTAEAGIYRAALTAGVYMYRETGSREARREADLIIRNKVYNRYIDCIIDLLDQWYMISGYRQYIRAAAGVIALCTYDRPATIDILDTTMVESWEIEQNTDGTYTRVTITYPEIKTRTYALKKWVDEQYIQPTLTDPRTQFNDPEKVAGKTQDLTHVADPENVAEEGSGVNYADPTYVPGHFEDEWHTEQYSVTGYLIGTAANNVFRHLGFKTYHGQAQSLEEANTIANHVLQYHSHPSYRLTLQNAKGILRLCPGMLFGVPCTLRGENVPILALCIARSVTHSFSVGGSHTMNITAELDPYNRSGRKSVISMDSVYAEEELRKPAVWAAKFMMIRGDYKNKMDVRMPRWLQNSMGSGRPTYRQPQYSL